MNRLTSLSAALLATLVAGSALAATATSTVKSMDASKRTVTMDNGQTYQVPAGMDLSMVKPGEKVKVTYETKNGVHHASRLEAAK